MLNLSQLLTIDLKTIQSPNLCERFDRENLDRIGAWVVENYERDVASRLPWSRRTEAAMDLAMQIQKDKSFPWTNCSNIAFPLVTIAALQFHARAYPAIVNGRSVVQCRVIGADPEGIAQARAERIGEHMSWQLLEQDESWEEEQDRALLNVPIVGCGWKKSFYDASKRHNVSSFVLAKDLVLDYWAKSIETCPVATHIIPFHRNEIHERVRTGAFHDVLDEAWLRGDAQTSVTSQTLQADNRAGIERPSAHTNTPFICLEQHCWLDLDGDGYAEPYIITVEESSQQVLRIVTRFDRIEDVEYNTKKEIIRIIPMHYFTKIPFIPSPDGGIMDIGFGTLLGPLNESVNSSINQLFDAGTMSNTAGGFLGRGAKIKGGVYEFKPFGWNRVDSTGDDLRKNIFPLPVREPSAVMFNLLNLLIDYTNRISGATDMMAGENPGQNTPAETSRAMIEQGQKIYSAIFKRIWRSMKQEFKKLYTLNAINLPSNVAFGESGSIAREDYSGGPASVVPTADPTIASDGARFAQATLLKAAALANPGYNVDEVERRYLKTLGIDQIDLLYPGQASMPPAPPDVKVQIQQMKNELAQATLEQTKMIFTITMQETQRVNNAKIEELTAKALKMEEEAKGESGKANVAAFRAGIEAMREQNNHANAQLDRMMEGFKNDKSSGSGAASTGGVPGMAGAPLDEGPNGLGSPEEGSAEGVLG